MPHFECGAFNHSATSPRAQVRAAEPPEVRRSSRRARRNRQDRRHDIFALVSGIFFAQGDFGPSDAAKTAARPVGQAIAPTGGPLLRA